MLLCKMTCNSVYPVSTLHWLGSPNMYFCFHLGSCAAPVDLWCCHWLKLFKCYFLGPLVKCPVLCCVTVSKDVMCCWGICDALQSDPVLSTSDCQALGSELWCCTVAPLLFLPCQKGVMNHNVRTGGIRLRANKTPPKYRSHCKSAVSSQEGTGGGCRALAGARDPPWLQIA